jgi:hypothetical protein
MKNIMGGVNAPVETAGGSRQVSAGGCAYFTVSYSSDCSDNGGTTYADINSTLVYHAN